MGRMDGAVAVTVPRSSDESPKAAGLKSDHRHYLAGQHYSAAPQAD